MKRSQLVSSSGLLAGLTVVTLLACNTSGSGNGAKPDSSIGSGGQTVAGSGGGAGGTTGTGGLSAVVARWARGARSEAAGPRRQATAARLRAPAAW